MVGGTGSNKNRNQVGKIRFKIKVRELVHFSVLGELAARMSFRILYHEKKNFSLGTKLKNKKWWNGKKFFKKKALRNFLIP